ncbi:MAG: YCF48-related protein, partial [Bacteroidales bacterium]|nr:YCF48-related protein [Bacteroidales bacterium]
MKKIIFFLSICLIALSYKPASAITYKYVLLVGDTAVLSVTNANGTIQWQESEDSLSWSDISGATTSQVTVVARTSGTGYRYFRAKVTNAATCTNQPWYSNNIKHKIVTSITQVLVGDFFQGGIVFWTDGVSVVRISSALDQYSGMTMQWGCPGTHIPGATSTINGPANTTAILAGCADRPIAASVCDSLTLNSYTDWYLPAKDELNYLYQQRALFGNFTFGYYWSSTCVSTTAAWGQDLLNGGLSNCPHNYSEPVRCIRKYASPTAPKLYNANSVTSEPLNPNITTQPVAQVKCLGTSLYFFITADGSQPLTYKWQKNEVDVPSSNNDTLFITNVTLADTGNYRCIVSNECDSDTSNNAHLTVPLPTITVNSPTICIGATATLTASGAVNYSWSTGSTNNPYTVSPTTTITYYITGTDGSGCSNTAQAVVTVNSLPTITVNSATICRGETVTLTASGAVSYSWNTGSTVNPYSVSPTTTITYSVTGTDGNSCANTTQTVITVNPLPTITVNSATICEGETATLTASGGNNYTWSTTSIENPYTVNPTVTTTYLVTGNDGNECANTTQTIVIVNELPVDINELVLTKSSEITADGNTIVLDHFNNSTTGELHATITYVQSICGLSNAAEFKNSNWLRYGYNANLQDAATFDFWIYPKAYSTPLADINWNNGATSYPGGGHVFHLDLNATGKITMSNWPGAGLGSMASKSALPLNKWTHVTVTWGANTIIYLNGEIDTLNSLSFRPSASGNYSIYIPKWGTANEFYLDELHISNKQRTIQEITNGNSYLGVFADADTLCENFSTDINITNPQTNIKYQLYKDALPQGNPQTAICDTLTFNTGILTSTSQFTIKATDTTTGCNIILDTVLTITVNELPTITVNSDTICIGATATLTASGAISYSWSTGSTNNPYSVNPTVTTTYYITGTDGNGCSNTAMAVVTVNPLPIDLSITNGLVAYYPFNNNANDESGYGNNGTLFGPSSVADKNSKSNSAYNFDGVDDYILINDPVPPVLQIQNEITLSAWIYATQYPATNRLLLIAGSQYDVSGHGATIFLDGRINSDGQTSPTGHIHFQIGDGTWHVSNSNSQVPLNQWVHIVATRKANENAKIYYNGVLQPSTSFAWTGSVSYTGAYFAIGRQRDYTDRFFKGTIDEVRVYNRALSGTEVSSLYQETISLVAYTVSDTICINSSTNINLVNSQSGVSYQLRNNGIDSGSPQIGNGNTLTFNTGILTSASPFTIKATDTTTGCNLILDSVLTIAINQLPTITVNSPTICNGATATLTASGGNSYSWDGGSTDNPLTINPAVTTTYYVTGTDGNLCSNTSQAIVTVYPLPTITVNSPTICDGATATLTASGGDNYSWNTGLSDNPVTVNPTVTTTYFVTGTDGNGCTNSAQAVVTVNPSPDIIASSMTICSGTPTAICASGGSTYSWSGGQNTTCITVNPTQTTSYAVSGTDINGCTNTGSAIITIYSLTEFTQLNSGVSCLLSGVYFTDANNGYVVGGNNWVTPTSIILKTTNGGTNWATQFSSSTMGIALYSVYSTNASISYASGYNGTIMKTIDGGAFWYNLNSGKGVGYQLSSIVFTSSSTGFVAGFYQPSNNDGTILKTTNAGASWTSVVSGAATCLGRIYFPDANTGYAVGSTNIIYKTTDGGTNWLTINSGTGGNFSSVHFTDANTGYVTSGGAVYKTTDGGNNWVNQTVGITNLCTVYFKDANTGYASGYSGTVMKTTDGGMNWFTQTSGTTNNLYSIHFSDAKTVYIAGDIGTILKIKTLSLPEITVNSPTICIGATATLTASGGDSYSWYSGSTDNPVTVNPTVTTTYSVTGTDGNGCTSSAQAIVTVNPLPIITVNSPSICIGATATLTASGGDSYSWDSGSSDNPLTVNPTITTTYLITGTDGNSCSNTNQTVVTINPLPTITVNSPTICDGATATLTASGGDSYSWDSGSTDNPVTVNPSVATTYSVTGTDVNSCSNTAQTVVSVNTLPQAEAGNNQTVCNGESVTLTASGGTDYSWSNGVSQSVPFTPSFTVTYTVTVSGGNSCTATDNVVVTVNMRPDLGASGGNVCFGKSLEINANNADTYTWSNGTTGSQI